MSKKQPQPCKAAFRIDDRILTLIKREYPDTLTYSQIRTRLGFNPGPQLAKLKAAGLIERMTEQLGGYKWVPSQ